jgi:pre-mRNA-splicing factor CWC22
MSIPEQFEMELCRMIIECAANEKQYIRYHGLLAERFCKLDTLWREHFERCFGEIYQTIYRLETNKIRNVAKLFGHLLESDSVTWAVLECIMLTEADTTSASRIFIKFLFQDLAEYFGVQKLQERLREPDFEVYFAGLFPVNVADEERLRFSINFFSAIGLGAFTDDLRAAYERFFPSEPERDFRDVRKDVYYDEEEERSRRYRKRSPSRSRSPSQRYRSGTTGRRRSPSLSPVRIPQRYR